MRKLHLWGNSGTLALILLGFSYFSTQISNSEQLSNTSQPDATINSTDQISTGQTPEELGLEAYRELVRQAQAKVSLMSTDVPIKFPLAVNSPIRMEEENINSVEPIWEAIGFVDLSGQAQPITPADLNEMFAKHLDSLNSANSVMLPSAQQNLDVTPNQTLPQTEEVPVIDLIALNTQTGQKYLIPKVRFMSVFRDAINGTLNGNLSEHNLDVFNLDLRIITPEQEGILEL